MVELGDIVVKDRDVSFMTVYGFTFLRVNINQGEGDSSVLSEIKLYSVLHDQVHRHNVKVPACTKLHYY